MTLLMMPSGHHSDHTASVHHTRPIPCAAISWGGCEFLASAQSMASDEGSSVASSEIDRLLGISEGEDDEDGGEPDTSFVSRLSAADDATTSPGEGGDRTWAAPAGPLGHEDSYGSPNMTAEAPVPEFHSSDSQHAPSAESWARLNDALQQNGFPALPIVTLFAEPRSGAPSFVLSPDPARLFQTLDTVLTNYANRGCVLSDTAGRGA